MEEKKTNREMKYIGVGLLFILVLVIHSFLNYYPTIEKSSMGGVPMPESVQKRAANSNQVVVTLDNKRVKNLRPKLKSIEMDNNKDFEEIDPDEISIEDECPQPIKFLGDLNGSSGFACSYGAENQKIVWVNSEFQRKTLLALSKR